MFHEEVQKEISRRQNLEKKKKERTVIDLIGDSLPTNLPEMAAQQKTTPETFDISVDPPDMQVEEPEDTQAPMQTVEVETRRVKRRARRSMEVDKPVPVVIAKVIEDEDTHAPMQTDEVKTQRVKRRVRRSMDVDRPDDETTGAKRPPPESVDERMKKAARGDEIINNFPDYLKNSGWTVPMIKHQFIMHGVDFEPNATKKI